MEIFQTFQSHETYNRKKLNQASNDDEDRRDIYLGIT